MKKYLMIIQVLKIPAYRQAGFGPAQDDKYKMVYLSFYLRIS